MVITKSYSNLHFIFSSCVPRVRSTSAAKTSLNVRPLDELELLEKPDGPTVEVPAVAAAAVSNVLDAREPVAPLWPPNPN